MTAINGENGFLLQKYFTMGEFVNRLNILISSIDREFYRKNARLVWERKFMAKYNFPIFVEMIKNNKPEELE